MLVCRSLVTAVLAAVTLVIGCSSSGSSNTAASSKADAGSADSGVAKAAPKTKPKTAALKGKGGKTPPANATSKGKQSRPKTGSIEVPIDDVEVFVFEEILDEGGQPETIFWAYVEGTGTFLWATGSVTCGNGATDANAGFLMLVQPDGTGSWLFSLPGCPSSDLFGCDFDASGTETTCGACAVEDGVIVCAVAG